MPKDAHAARRLDGHASHPGTVENQRPDFEERRSAPRSDVSTLPPFAVRVVEGPVVHVLNVSRTGLLARSEARLMPGAVIGLRFVTADSVFTIVGKVVRSSLVAVNADCPLYESALAFTTGFPLLDDTHRPSGLPVEAFEPRADVQNPHTGTRSGFPREIGRLNGEPTVLTVTAFAGDSSDSIRKVLAIHRHKREDR